MVGGIKINRWHTEIGAWDLSESKMDVSTGQWSRLPYFLEIEEGILPIPSGLEKLTSHLQSTLESSFFGTIQESSFPLTIALPWYWKSSYYEISKSIQKNLSWKEVRFISEPMAIAAFYHWQQAGNIPLIIDISGQAITLIDIHFADGKLWEKDTNLFNYTFPAGGRQSLLESIMHKADADSTSSVPYKISNLTGFLDTTLTPPKLEVIFRDRYLTDPENQQYRLLTEVDARPVRLKHLLEAEDEWMSSLRPVFDALQGQWPDITKRQVVFSGEMGTHLRLQKTITEQLGVPIPTSVYPTAATLGAALIAGNRVEIHPDFSYVVAILTGRPHFNAEEGNYVFKEEAVSITPEDQKELEEGSIVFCNRLFQFSETSATMRLVAHPVGQPTALRELQARIQVPENYLRHRFRLGLQVSGERSWHIVFESTLDKYRIFQSFQLP